MDYIFYAINALAAGLTGLLLSYRFRPAGQTQFRLFEYLVALAIVLAYYSLDAYLLSRIQVLYYIANLLPIVALIIALAFVLRHQAVADR